MKSHISVVKIATVAVFAFNYFILTSHAQLTLSDPNIWTGETGTSAWGTAANWSEGTFPQTAGTNVLFNDTDIALNGKNITLGADRTIGSMEVTSEKTFMISGNTLTFDNSGADSQLILSGTGGLTINSSVSLNNALEVNVSENVNQFIVNGSVIGDGSIVKTGDGIVTLSNINTYAGATIVNNGGLTIASFNGISADSAITVASGAMLTLTNGITTNQGIAGAGTISLGTSKVLTVNNADDAIITTTIAGTSSSLMKTGSGTLTLSSVNAYTGATNVTGGELVISGSIADGTISVTNGTVTLTGSKGTGAVTLNSGGIFNLEEGAISSSNSIITVFAGGEFHVNTDYTQAVNITGSSNGKVVVAAGKTLTLSNTSGTISITPAIIGDGSVVKTGNGAATFNGINTYTGATMVNGGGLTIASFNGISADSAITVALTLANGMTTNQGIAGTGTVLLGTSKVLTVNNANDASITAEIAGTSGILTKTGNGTLTLYGANTYMGKTTISAGGMVVASGAALGNTMVEVRANTFLTVNGIIENDSKTTAVNQGGTLYGIGTLNGDATVAGILAPGAGNEQIGTLSFANNLTLNSTASVRIEIDHQTLDFDRMIIGGNINLNNATLNIDLIGLSLFSDTRSIFSPHQV